MTKVTTIAFSLPIALCASLVPAQSVETPAPAAPTKVEAPAAPQVGATPSIERPGGDAFSPQWQSIDDDTSSNSGDFFMPIPRTQEQTPQSPSLQTPFPSFAPGPSMVMDPFAMLQQEMERMHQMQRSMNQQMSTMMATMPGMSVQSHSMSTSGGNIQDQGNHYAIDLQMTGMDQASTSISVDGNQVVLQSEVHQTNSNSRGGAQYQMSYVNHVQRRWTLPPDADLSAIDSTFNGDHVVIVIPKQGLR